MVEKHSSVNVQYAGVRKVNPLNIVFVKFWAFLMYILSAQILVLRRIVFLIYVIGTIFIQSSRSASCSPSFLPQGIMPWFWVITYEGCGPVFFSDAGTYRVIQEENKFYVGFDTCLPHCHFCLLHWEKCSVCCSSTSKRSMHQGYASTSSPWVFIKACLAESIVLCILLCLHIFGLLCVRSAALCDFTVTVENCLLLGTSQG